ncbi:MAG TPA: hypothetical protein PK098_03010 [Phycisphaerales bacterium]|nr:hypothetical protein [Phycisphaerales bacterium]
MSRPVKALHLIDPGSPGGGACSLSLLAAVQSRIGSIEHDVLILGTRRHVDLAKRCGVKPTGSLSAPLHVPGFGRRGLARFIHEREHGRGRYDFIHAWTPRAATLAMLAAPHHRRLATFSVGPLTGVHGHYFQMLIDQRPMPVLVSSTGVLREYRSMGIDRRLLSLLPPGVAVETEEVTPREALRKRWGASRSTFVIGVLSEPANWADAQRAVEIAARLHVSERNVKLLLHPSAIRRADAERWLRSLGQGDIVVVEDDLAEPWRVARGLDAAMFIGGEMNSMDLRDSDSPWSLIFGGGRRLRPMPGIMPLLWAMAHGVPVIAEASDAVSDVVEEGVSGLLVGQGDINAACDRLIRMYDDRTIAGRIGAGGSARVEKRFHISAFCVRLRQAYDMLLAGRPVRVIPEDDDPIVEQAVADPRGVRQAAIVH